MWSSFKISRNQIILHSFYSRSKVWGDGDINELVGYINNNNNKTILPKIGRGSHHFARNYMIKIFSNK